MPIKFGGFGRSITGKTTPQQILNQGKAIDDDLASGERIVADLKKDEKKALEYYLAFMGEVGGQGW